MSKEARVKVSIYKTPKGNGQKQQLCARLISEGTKQTDEICKFISECSTVTSADVKGVLEALVTYIGRELSYGYRVELEGLGHFSPAIKNNHTINEDGSVKYNAQIGGVNFRCSQRLKKLVKRDRPQKIERENIPTSDRDGRKAAMLKYLQNHPYINQSDYAEINTCTRYCAANDIKLFVDEGIVKSMGYRTHRVYIPVKNTGLDE